MSRQDEPLTSPIEDGQSASLVDDDQLQIHLRLGLDEIAAVEGEELRKTSTPEQPTEHELLDLAERLYESRRRRDRMFTVKLFGEPAWDMLLALYYMPRRGIMLGVMSLGHAANIPPTTGVRWQKVLEEQGFIERGPKVTDSRQQLVRLTETGRALMSKYLIRLYYCNEGLPTF